MLYFAFRERGKERIAVVTGADDMSANLEIPAEKEGLRVREIGDRAFAGLHRLKSVRIPESVDTVGSFAFHNCRSLREIGACDSVADVRDGVIRAAAALRTIRFIVRRNDYTLMTRLLQDSDNTLTFDLSLPDGHAMLTFPGFVYDFTENTMARAIQFEITGSGMAFRECADRTGIDYAAYDRLFERALLDEISIITDVVFGRLMFPYALSERARESYEGYLRTHAERILHQLIVSSETEKIRYYTTHDLIGEKALSTALSCAAQKKDARITALLMERAAALRPKTTLLMTL